MTNASEQKIRLIGCLGAWVFGCLRGGGLRCVAEEHKPRTNHASLWLIDLHWEIRRRDRRDRNRDRDTAILVAERTRLRTIVYYTFELEQ